MTFLIPCVTLYAIDPNRYEKEFIMKNLNFLQIFGFTVEIFSFVAILINMITNDANGGSRLPFYLLFLVGVILVAVGNIIKRNKK